MERKSGLQLITQVEIELHSSISMTYEYRLKALNESCDYSNSTPCNIQKYTSDSLLHQHPSLKSVTLILPSHSLMYCAVPKVATKAILTAMIYVHLRDISNHLDNNWTNIDAVTARTEKLINISLFIKELKKNAITIPKEDEPKSLAEFLRTYLNILRFGNINTTSTSPPLNPWRVSLLQAFPYLHLKGLSNLSQIFSLSSTRAIFVRHPLERLASAYKERIAILNEDRIQAEPGYDAMRETICRYHLRIKTNRPSYSDIQVCKKTIPSFEQFIQYILIDTNVPNRIPRMDYHWQPYSILCQVCKFKYNFIGKYETFNDDFTYLLKRLNLSDWNIKKRHGASGQTTQYYQQLYSTLSDELICRLIRLYDQDFRLFNYRVDDYVNRTGLIQSCNRSRISEPITDWSKKFLSKRFHSIDHRLPFGIDHSFKQAKEQPLC